MVQIIVAFSGKKQSGKDTSSRFLTRNAPVMFADTQYESVDLPGAGGGNVLVPIRGKKVTAKIYSMAGPLKAVCMNVLGLTYEQCWGTDEQKNTLTRYKWEDLPHYQEISESFYVNAMTKHEEGIETAENMEEARRVTADYQATLQKGPQQGLMTARQVMQEVGTGIFRRMYNNVWNEACLRDIHTDGHDVAVINDCRFPDEVAAIQAAGGKVFRLTRFVTQADEHESEKALDADRYDWSKFDHVIDNREMSVEEQNLAVYKTLTQWGLIKHLPKSLQLAA